MITIDGNGAVASVAFRTSEVIAIYPITPVPRWQNRLMPGPETAKTFGETHHAWLKCSRKRGYRYRAWRFADGCSFNIVYVIAGFAADDPDAVQTGRRTHTVCPACSGTYRCHTCTLYFGDHSDVMAVRQTGCAMLCAANVRKRKTLLSFRTSRR